MAEKLDTSPEEEAIKDEARELMTGLVGSGAGDQTNDSAGAPTADGADIIKAWKSKYSAAPEDTTMEDFWSLYDPYLTSIWKMVYDEADSNENLKETIGFVEDLLAQPGMTQLKKDHDCWCVVHTLENLGIEGVWFFNGPDPSKLFAANEDTSWYTFTQLGPEAIDPVKAAVAKIMMPIEGKLNGKVVKDTKVFC
mmetsp:Transcript_25898/g.51933  ORF Transcript_25898/g.51933 Transcript_25898/m.51933 type:complete len:195 (+) Transcript_25898:111-695(+)